MINQLPLVSIIVNCFNGEEFLDQSIESVLSQNYQNWELIFWDNQSTDKSAEIVNSINDERIKYFYAPKHTILYEARNYAVEKSAGDFLAFLDVDDWWEPNKLDEQIKLFSNSKIGIVCSNYYTYNNGSKKERIKYNFQLPSGNITNSLLKLNTVGLLTLIIRKSCLQQKNLKFNPNYHIIGDFDLIIKISIDWEIGSVQYPLAHYRLHENSESSKNKDLIISEFESWILENENNLKRNKNWEYMKSYVAYFKAINDQKMGKIKSSILEIFQPPINKYKLRLLVALLIPKKFLNHILNLI
jgi:glycosyltransferase involved in cell wall biosynthesis